MDSKSRRVLDPCQIKPGESAEIKKKVPLIPEQNWRGINYTWKANEKLEPRNQ